MKKLFTIDDIMIAFISALGYGFGETFSRLLGWPRPACLGASLVLGIALESVLHKIVYSEAVQRKPARRALVCAACVFLFVLAHSLSVRKLGVSMLGYLRDQFAYVVGFPILGFLVNLLIRAWRVNRVRRRYGDGSRGYVFDVKEEDIDAVNGQNRPVAGDYDADCAVRTRTGVYVGERQGKALHFLGIPYARPPVGALRWKAPEPLAPSQAVYEAAHFGPSAIQVEHAGSILRHHRQSEDCLYLNICVAANRSEAKRPVLVLFNHGDFSFGGAADPLLYGDHLVAAHPEILFVSFNYRLGLFGFIDFSRVPGGRDYPDALNLGLLDQVAALEWIRENIAAFGGDPDRITVMGFAAGATSICLLSASPRARGLFQRAFLFNGSPEMAYDTPEAARDLAKNLLRETGAATMDDLTALSARALKDAAQRLWRNLCAPTLDGALIPGDVYGAWQAGAARDIEFIVGIPDNERQVFRAFVGNENYRHALESAAADVAGDIDAPAAGAVRAWLEAQATTCGKSGAKAKLLEQWNALCLHRVAATLARGGSRVRLMVWAEKPLIDSLGSGTVDAAAALLGNGKASQLYGNVMNADLSEVLQCLLSKFVRGEAPALYPNEIKGVDALAWDAFPRALVVEGGALRCEEIADRLTNIPELRDLFGI